MKQERSKKMEKTRQSVLKAAQDLLTEQGPQAFSMRRLAARLGWTVGNLYYYFADKKELLQAVAAEGYGKLARAVELADDKTRPTPLRFVRMLRAYMDWVLAHHTLYFMMTAEPAAKEQTEVLRPAGAVRGALGRMVALVERGNEEGVFDCAEPALSCRIVWASTYGVLDRMVTEQPQEEHRQALMRRHCQMMLRALGAEEENE